MNQDPPSHQRADRPSRPPGGITLHIERLVIDGLPSGSAQAAVVQAAVAAELTRLLTEGELSPRLLAGGGTLPALRAGTIQVATSNSTRLGGQIARAVHGSLTKGAAP